MKDVIFSGCATRKASTSAEVTLEIDNKKRILPKIDQDTVIITRKASATGSDFFINNQPARLKDVQELFLDTGLGSNSYSMIGQEQTKRLLSEKTEERRTIFEEAAGIVKLKKQKETTEKHLDEVEQDFVRLNDILKELERQVKPLQKQRDKAQQYVAIQKVLTETETDFLSVKYKRLSQEGQSLDKEILLHSEQLESTSNEVNALELELSSLKDKLKALNEEIFTTQESKAELKEQIDSRINSKQLNQERINTATNELTDIHAEITEIEEKFSVSVDEFNVKKNRYAELESIITATQNKRDELNQESFRSQTDLNLAKNKVERLRELITSLYNEYQECKIRFEQHNRDEESLLSEMDTLEDKKRNANTLHLSCKEKLDQAEINFKQNSDFIQSLSEQLNEVKSEQLILQQQLGQSEVNLRDSQNELVRKKTLLDSLESSIENLDGLFEGVKNVLKNKSSLEGVLDIVSNLFNVQSGSEIALDSMLSSVVQYIVVDSIDNAKKAVNFLKHNRLGRATFLPLDNLSPRSFNENELRQIEQYEGITTAISSISYKKELEPLFLHLLGRNLIATDMDTAVEFYKQSNIKTKIVTLDGDVLQPGTISGGTRSKKGLISKRKELDTLKVEVNQLSSKIEQLTSEYKLNQQKVNKLSDENNSLSRQLDSEKESNNQLLLELERVQREYEHAKNAFKELDVAKADLKYRYDESKKASSSLFTKYKEKESLHQSKSNELSLLLNKIKEDELSLEKIKELETNCLIQIEKFEEEKRNLTEFISEQENGKDSFEKRLEFLQAKRYSNEQKIEQATQENLMLSEELNSYNQEYDITDEQLSSLQKDKTQTEQSMDTSDKTLKTIRVQLSELKETVHSLSLTKNTVDSDIETLLKRALEAYQKTAEDLLEHTSAPINEVASEKEIKSLIKELKSIGNVNLDAIKDFEELNTRYQAEKAQLEDVREAKKDLEHLLKDVTSEMHERFVGTFKDIAKHFEKTFVELFGGGYAKLSLEDSKKPLTSHILITAQPPGKKPKKIELLSGGEKNLTVCALVFAIIKAKPSPFVYLDEIDAPLDDANVSRFAQYLKEVSEKTQFICVTHRKGTMMAADVLFGVTQETLGITTVFPYNLQQEEERKTSNG